LLLAGCAGHDPYVTGGDTRTVGHWRIEQQVDRVTGAPISNAQVGTTNVSNGRIPFPPPARMQLLCFKERPSVLIVFAFKIGSTRNAELGYRFDDKPGHQPTVRIVEGYKSVVIEDPVEVARFANEMATSSILYIHICALNALRTSVPGRRRAGGDCGRLCRLSVDGRRQDRRQDRRFAARAARGQGRLTAVLSPKDRRRPN
jgi:hypothetical protein